MRAAFRIALVALLALLPRAGHSETPSPDFVVLFGTGASQLTPEAQQIVTLAAQRAAQQHPTSIAVAGYGDADGGGDTELANSRAEAVIRGLVAAGVAPSEVKQVPPAPPATATGIPVHKVTVTFMR